MGLAARGIAQQRRRHPISAGGLPQQLLCFLIWRGRWLGACGLRGGGLVRRRRYGARPRGEGGADGVIPGADANVSQIGFVADIFLAVEEKLGEVSESFGATSGNAAGADELEEFSDDVIDVRRSAELAGDGREPLGDSREADSLGNFGLHPLEKIEDRFLR